MKRILLLSLVAASFLQAQDWAKAALDKSPRHHEWVSVQRDGRTVQAFVVYPESSNKAPVILMIHEIFGLTDWVQDMADQLAAAGYIVIAPDLLSGLGEGGKGSSAFDQQGAVKAVSGLDPQQVTTDLQATADYALKLPAANGKIFVVGFCWGGGQSFRFATNRQDLRAAFVFYGPPPDKQAIARITAPVYGFYAGNDARIGATVPGTVEAMKEAGKTYEPETYPGAGHGFMRAGEAPDATDANRQARSAALARLNKLLAQYSK
jgi:carboxymethylenebutenolidase